MLKTIGFLLLWIGFLSYGFLFAPPEDPNTFKLIEKLSAFEIEDINPIIVSVFNLMGILPFMYAPLLLLDGKDQKLWAWPFTILSFGIGAFAILPYLAFRKPNPEFSGQINWFLKGINSRIFGTLLSLTFLAIFLPGVITGNWNEFITQWQTNRFIHVMSLDFCLLILLFPALLKDDLVRRDISDSKFFQTLIWIPLLGPLTYFCIRPPFGEEITASPTTSQVSQT